MISTPLKDISRLRNDFPILRQTVGKNPLVYLDNGATSQKPQAVIDAVDHYWKFENANVHRGVHYLSQVATDRYEHSRKSAHRLLRARQPEEIIFTKGCTEAINLVAEGLSSGQGSKKTNSSGLPWLQPGDKVLVSEMEHHSNIVPWQIAAERSRATVVRIPVTDSGELDLDAYSALIKSGSVKVVAITHVSNAMGTINPIKEIVRLAHEVGALTVIDGAQAAPHLRIDVQDLDADFYAMAGHKMYAPTGIGLLYGKRSLLEDLPAYQGGGDMIRTVDIEGGTTYAELPAKFEAGTPNIAGAVGLGAAIDYLESIEPDADDPLASAFRIIGEHEARLEELATAKLSEIPGLKIHGTAKEKAGIVSFVLQAAHPHDVGTILDHRGVAVRTGHHCCMPLMRRFGYSATTRASFAFYNNEDDVDTLVSAVKAVEEMFRA